MIRKRLKPFVLAAIAASCAVVPSTAFAYCMDHSILLCMAGGFPPGVVCNKALAVVIQRVTPFPIEPPLQLWRCPLKSHYSAPYQPKNTQPIRAAFLSQPLQSGKLKLIKAAMLGIDDFGVRQALAPARFWLAQAAGDDYLAFTRELRVIYGSGYRRQSERNGLRWRTTLKVCDNESKNCAVSTHGTGQGGGENGNIGVGLFPGPSYTHHSKLFNKSVSIQPITGRALRLLYWDFEGNPTLTEWIKY